MDNVVKRKRIAVIPARAGSKRIHRKNLIDFFGKPLLAWTVEAALDAAVFKRVLVSTEDAEIAEIARACGADVPFLRERCFDDHSTISDVAIHVLEQVAARLGEQFDDIVLLQASCPLRDAKDISLALAAFERADNDFQMSCFQFHWSNPWWAFERDVKGQATWLHLRMLQMRSQDQPPLFGLTGAICLARVPALLKACTFYGPGQRFEPISWISAVDIDNEDDLQFARAAYALKHGLI
jgi:CMP-N-acetylneuraminic acid synthetase